MLKYRICLSHKTSICVSMLEHSRLEYRVPGHDSKSMCMLIVVFKQRHFMVHTLLSAHNLRTFEDFH